MNIFAVSKHPRKCARALDDKRLNKMILETTQIICTVINLTHGYQVTLYKSCHINHPAVRWAMKNAERGALAWLYRLGISYGEEILYRFERKHACHLILEGLDFSYRQFLDPPESLYELKFYNGASHRTLRLDYSEMEDVHKAYRLYLIQRWKGDKRKPKWTRRGPPSWYR